MEVLRQEQVYSIIRFDEKCIHNKDFLESYSPRPQKLVTTNTARILNYFNSISDLVSLFLFFKKYEKEKKKVCVCGFLCVRVSSYTSQSFLFSFPVGKIEINLSLFSPSRFIMKDITIMAVLLYNSPPFLFVFLSFFLSPVSFNTLPRSSSSCCLHLSLSPPLAFHLPHAHCPPFTDSTTNTHTHTHTGLPCCFVFYELRLPTSR